jgi:hypothetical protein
MKVAVMAGLFAKRDMNINARQRFMILVPLSIGILF